MHLSKEKKWFILMILVAAIFVGYVARMSISIALPFISREFSWTGKQQGLLGGTLLGVFLLGYGASNLFLSRYIDIYGSKKMLSFSILLWSLSLLLGAIFPTYYMILFSRLILGVSQGVLFPVASKVTSGWFEPSERARANSIYMSGGPFGVMLAPLLLTPVIIDTSWQTSFYLVFALGLVVLVPVVLFITCRPKEVNRCEPSVDELRYLSMLKNKQFVIVMIGYTIMSSVWWGLTLWLPTFLVEAKGIELGQISFGASVPYVGAVAGMYIGSYISDRYGRRKYLIVVSLILGGLFLLLITLLNIQSIYLLVVLLFLVFFNGQMAPPLFFTILQDMVHKSKMGAATGLMNGVGNGVGVIGPLLVGVLIAFTGSYNLGFSALGIMLVMGGLFVTAYKGR
ncbi:MAG: MFS transporter [Thermoplasmata archaeon]